MSEIQTSELPASFTASPSKSMNPLAWLVRLFSSIWLGIFLLTLLFIYSSIGSSGIPTKLNIFDPVSWLDGKVRTWRGLELTEFEWFHWWPFDVLIALICINIVVATAKRIPFNVLNLGVWMIHGGIITLALGSYWYFSTKVEGDAPVNRRKIVASAPGMEPREMAALPGNMLMLGNPNNGYTLQIIDIDPHWELLSGDDKGTHAYKVSVRVQSRGGEFIRELIANRPQYTQDLVRNPNAGGAGGGGQPWLRAVNAIGKPLTDEALQISLDYAPQTHFFLMSSRAIFLREVGQPDWVQRAIPPRKLPRFNDYIAAREDVWLGEGQSLAPDPIDVEVPATDPNDPLRDVTFRVSRFLRYAFLETRRRVDPGARLDPTVTVRLQSTSGESQQYQLVAFSNTERSALQNTIVFAWADSQQAIDRMKTRVDPTLTFKVPDKNVEVELPIDRVASSSPDLPFTPIEGTEYSYRVESIQSLPDMGVSLAILEIRTPERSFTRWVFDDPARNRDMAIASDMAQHDAVIPLDEKIQTTYKPGTLPPAPIVLIAGPNENDLAVLVTKAVGQPQLHSAKVGDQVAITENVSLIIEKYAARTVQETRPVVVPREQQDGSVGEFMSMIRLDVPAPQTGASLWLPYHHYAFAAPEEVLRRFPYRPQTITLADGRRIEFMFSRERMRLPAPVVLDDFKVKSHIGGFTGATSSIMDWTSVIRFENDATWGESKVVSVNKPAEHEGFWFFQAQWDPPDRARFEGDPGSRGLNYTVLGVGNRNGVNVQLAGCCIAVFGMIWGFYVKPAIKRRRQQAVYSTINNAEAHS